MSLKTHTWLSVGIGFLVIIILFFFVPRQTFAPKGIVLPTLKARSATSPANVQFYPSYPASYQVLGHISIELHFKQRQKSAVAEAMILKKAKALAAKVGANGLVVPRNGFFHSTPAEIGSAQAKYYLQGVAIYTQNLQSYVNSIYSQPND